jgi:Ca2+-binding RTX toxin-like protein
MVLYLTVFNFAFGNSGANGSIPNLDDLLGALLPPLPEDEPEAEQPQESTDQESPDEEAPTEAPTSSETEDSSVVVVSPGQPVEIASASTGSGSTSGSTSTTTTASSTTSSRSSSGSSSASVVVASGTGTPEVSIVPGIDLRGQAKKGRSTFLFTLARSGDTSAESRVAWAVEGRGRNAAMARDFRGKSLPFGTVDFQAGETSRTIRVRARPADQRKTFALSLDEATGAQLGRSQARATIAPRDNLIGTGRDDRIKGSQRSEFIQGGGGQDLLTGGGGEDLFGFRFGDSPIGTPDRITDFTFGEDRITLLNRKGKPGDLPTRFSRAADNSTARSLEELAAAVFADADGGRKGNQPLRRRSAALVRATNDEIAGTYLLINNNKAGLNPGKDLMVNITGFSGDLPELGRIDSGLVFA